MHFKRTVFKRGGGKATTLVRYLTRETVQPPEKESVADRQLRYLHREGREDLRYAASRNLPRWAEGNPHTYFRTAEQQEWARGNAFEEWKLTLPYELTPGQNMALMRDLIDTIAGDRLPITYVFHAPQTLQETHEQPHLHLLISGRQQDGIERPKDQHFKKYNTQHPAKGGAPKDPALYHYRAVKAWRITLTDVVNLHLERAGREARVHPDRLEDRDIARKPEPKLLPSESQAYREHGPITPTMAEVLAIRAARTETRAAEDADAQAYWAARKATLGLTQGMDAPAQLAAIQAARALVRDQAPTQVVIHSAVGVEVDDRMLVDLGGERYRAAWAEGQALWQTDVEEPALRVQALQALIMARQDVGEVWRVAQAEQLLRETGWDLVRESRLDGQSELAEDLLGLVAQLDALTQGEGHGGARRVRLWEKESGQGL